MQEDLSVFRKYQKQLCDFANHKAGKQFLGLDTERIDKRPVSAVLPNGIMLAKEHGFNQAHIYIGQPHILHKLGLALSALDIARSWNNSLHELQGLFHYTGLAKNDFIYPLIHFATVKNVAAGDGTCQDSQAVSWAAMRALATAPALTVIYDDTSWTTSNANYLISRAFIPADFSSLSARVAAISFFGYVLATTQLASSAMAIVPTAQASIASLAATDFANVTVNSSPEYCARQNHGTDNFPLNAYKEIVFNATGITAAQNAMTGSFKAGYRSSFDLDNTDPSSVQGERMVKFDASDGTNIPYYSLTLASAIIGFI